VPDPGAAVGNTIYSPTLAAAEAVLPAVHSVLTTARVVSHGGEVGGPASFELRAQSQYDGATSVGMSRATQLPLALSRLDWREHGPFAYRIDWHPSNPDDLVSDHPSRLHVIARSRAAPQVARAAWVLARSIGGAVMDEQGFLVDADDLELRMRGPRG